jgi:hypothetical protein
MNKAILTIFCGVLLLVMAASRSFCADIGCTVKDANGKGVPGVTVNVTEYPAVPAGSGKVLGSGVTDDSGNYRISGVPRGTFNVSLIPGSAPIIGQTVVAEVHDRFNIIDWTASNSAPAIAEQKEGFSCYDAAILGAGGAVGGTLIGLCVGEVICTFGDEHPASGSL